MVIEVRFARHGECLFEHGGAGHCVRAKTRSPNIRERVCQRLGVGEVLDGRTIGFDRFDQRRELGEFTRDLHIAFGGELTERFGLE